MEKGGGGGGDREDQVLKGFRRGKKAWLKLGKLSFSSCEKEPNVRC